MIDQLRKVADEANFIAGGYAFTLSGDIIRVLNLNNPSKAIVFNHDGLVLETSMDDIEAAVVRDYLERNRKFLGA